MFITKKNHDKNVIEVINQMKDYKKINNNPFTIKRSLRNSHSQRSYKFKENCNQIDITSLNKIINLDILNREITLEPNVKMDYIVKELLKYNLRLQVVPEFKTFTIGGCVAGLGVETSSHNFGLFPDTVISYDVILGNGKLITCSRDQNEDLFYGLPGSYCTLGIIVSIKIKLVPATKFIKLEYYLFNDILKFKEKFQLICNKEKSDYLEGLVNEDKTYSLIIGNHVLDHEVDNNNIYSLDKHYSQWYHLRPHEMTNNKKYNFEYVDTYSYFFRYDLGTFWVGDMVLPSNIFSKYLFNWIFTADAIRYLNSKIQSNENREKKYIVTDIGTPLSKIDESLQFVDKNTGVTPIWICPIKFDNNNMKIFWKHNNSDNQKYWLDIGIYGSLKNKELSAFEINKKIEKYVHEDVKGMKGLFSISYYTKEKFWEYFNKQKYDELRKKYHAENSFMNIYDKVVTGLNHKSKKSNCLKIALKKILSWWIGYDI